MMIPALRSHVSRHRFAWYLVVVAAASASFQFGLNGALHHLLWG